MIKNYLKDRKSIREMEKQFRILAIDNNMPLATPLELVKNPLRDNYGMGPVPDTAINNLAKQILIAKKYGVDVAVMWKLAK